MSVPRTAASFDVTPSSERLLSIRPTSCANTSALEDQVSHQRAAASSSFGPLKGLHMHRYSRAASGHGSASPGAGSGGSEGWTRRSRAGQRGSHQFQRPMSEI